MYLDFLKTFDRVDWDFIFSSLQKFGYGDNIVCECPLSVLVSIIADNILANFFDGDERIPIGDMWSK